MDLVLKFSLTFMEMFLSHTQNTQAHTNIYFGMKLSSLSKYTTDSV